MNTTTTDMQNHLTTMTATMCQVAARACGLPLGAKGDEPKSYSAPEDPYQDWKGGEHHSFLPNARQQKVMDAVAKALDLGLSYNVDVNAHVAAILHIPADVLAKNTVRTEGGNFGYDVYLARQAVEAKRKHAKREKVASELRLVIGDKLGTIVFNDFKRNTSAVVEAVSDDGMVLKITAKRGSASVRIMPCPLQLKNAIDRAHERGNRKDSYQQFVATRQHQAPTAIENAAKVASKAQAPLTKQQVDQLHADAKDLRGAAARKGTVLDRYDEARERAAAKDFFGLGTWLFYYSKRVYRSDGLKDRIDCLRRLFEAGIYQPGYQFFTVFDFGARQFDTLVEMGDADQVLDGLREIAHEGRNANLIAAFSYMGWSLERKQMALF